MDVLSHFLNFIFILLCGWLAAYIAAKKGRSAITWFFLGFFLNIFALLFLIFLPPVSKKAPRDKSEGSFTGTTIDVKPIATEEKNIEPVQPEKQEWYYLDQQRQQAGPINFQKLKDLYHTSTINDSTYLWCEGMDEWRKLSEFKNLFNPQR